MNNKIISRFYVIYGDEVPIYVGYTNRTVKQRFKEHQKDKDFSSYSKVEVKEVDRLEFDFTWNTSIVDSNAKSVSNKETALIKEYNTQDSKYQKGRNALLGGAVWSDTKHFIRFNRNNPKFTGLSDTEVISYLNTYRAQVVKLHNFIGSYRDPRRDKIHSFISHYRDPRELKLSTFIKDYKDPRETKLRDFIKDYKDYRVDKLKAFIGNYRDPRELKLSTFIKDYKDPRQQKLKNFIIRYKDPRVSKISNFIVRYK